MKTKVLIIEDNYCKFFATKQILEAQLKVRVNAFDVVDLKDTRDLLEKTTHICPDVIMICPNGGVVDVLEKMKKRGTNRRNTEITLLLVQDADEAMISKMMDLFSPTNSDHPVARAA